MLESFRGSFFDKEPEDLVVARQLTDSTWAGSFEPQADSFCSSSGPSDLGFASDDEDAVQGSPRGSFWNEETPDVLYDTTVETENTFLCVKVVRQDRRHATFPVGKLSVDF